MGLKPKCKPGVKNPINRNKVNPINEKTDNYYLLNLQSLYEGVCFWN